MCQSLCSTVKFKRYSTLIKCSKCLWLFCDTHFFLLFRKSCKSIILNYYFGWLHSLSSRLCLKKVSTMTAVSTCFVTSIGDCMDFSERTHHYETGLDQRMQPYFDNVIICCSACSIQLACIVGQFLLKYFVYCTTTTHSFVFLSF